MSFKSVANKLFEKLFWKLPKISVGDLYYVCKETKYKLDKNTISYNYIQVNFLLNIGEERLSKIDLRTPVVILEEPKLYELLIEPMKNPYYFFPHKKATLYKIPAVKILYKNKKGYILLDHKSIFFRKA